MLMSCLAVLSSWSCRLLRSPGLVHIWTVTIICILLCGRLDQLCGPLHCQGMYFRSLFTLLELCFFAQVFLALGKVPLLLFPQVLFSELSGQGVVAISRDPALTAHTQEVLMRRV